MFSFYNTKRKNRDKVPIYTDFIDIFNIDITLNN